jgi:hypothetical protein
VVETRSVHLTLAALVLAAGACGGSGGSLPFDELGDELMDAYCDYAVACEGVPDRATCLASLTFDQSELATLGADIMTGIVRYDGKAARQCVDVFGSLASCKRTVVGDVDARLDDVCGKVFAGTLAPGAACITSEECANDGVCDRPGCATECCAGTCIARPPAIPAGGDCSSLEALQQCAAGTRCVFDSVTGAATCRVPLPRGASCTLDGDCAEPYSCVPPDPLAAAAFCTAPVGLGQSCANVGCDDIRDYCDPVTSICTARIPVGGACDPNTPTFCIGYAWCDGTTCVALPGPGATCDANNDRCLASLTCDANLQCTLPPAGGSCR